MDLSDKKSVTGRAARLIQEQGVSGFSRRLASYGLAEFSRLGFKFRGRGGPSLIAENRHIPPNPSSVKKILFIRLWGMGDMVLSIPALKMLRNKYEDAEIMVVAFPQAMSILENDDIVDHKISISPESVKFSSPDLYAVLGQAVIFRPDLVIAAYPLINWRVYEMIDRMGARWAYAAEQDADPEKVTRLIVAPDDKSVVLINADLAIAAGCDPRIPRTDLFLDQKSEEKIEKWLHEKIGDRPAVTLNFGHSPDVPNKDWPVEHAVSLTRALIEQLKIKPILLSGPNEMELLRAIKNNIPDPPIIPGPELSLKETMALIKRSQLVISNNSLWMHVAAALRAPLLAVSASVCGLYHPFGNEQKTMVIGSGEDCAPCWKPGRQTNCDHYPCMRNITPDMVLKAAAEMLERKE